MPISVSGITLQDDELSFDFIRSSGPGGQNVNKVSTAVQLRFDAEHSPSLPEDVRQRLLAKAGKRLTVTGEIVIEARRFRTQERNREDAVERLTELIRTSAKKPVRRRKTKPTKASLERRISEKKRLGEKKRLRGRPEE